MSHTCVNLAHRLGTHSHNAWANAIVAQTVADAEMNWSAAESAIPAPMQLPFFYEIGSRPAWARFPTRSGEPRSIPRRSNRLP